MASTFHLIVVLFCPGVFLLLRRDVFLTFKPSQLLSDKSYHLHQRFSTGGPLITDGVVILFNNQNIHKNNKQY